jgi:hypothetical protein
MSALEKFKDWGLTFNKPSNEQVVLPADITDVSSEQLGELFTRLTAWTDYIASQMAMAVLEERAALKKKEFAENSMLIKRMGSQAKGERITAIKAEVSIHPDVVVLDNDYEEKYAYRKLVEMLLQNHERDLQLVSREITRRSNDARFSRKEFGV